MGVHLNEEAIYGLADALMLPVRFRNRHLVGSKPRVYKSGLFDCEFTVEILDSLIWDEASAVLVSLIGDIRLVMISEETDQAMYPLIVCYVLDKADVWKSKFPSYVSLPEFGPKNFHRTIRRKAVSKFQMDDDTRTWRRC